ncbi:MAG: SRPBCC domain-containing protein [Candidatus Binataceae bacterium]
MQTNSNTEPAERTLVITRVFDAPRALVFKAWTQPRHLARWWGPAGYSLASCEMDLRPGGAYRFQMKSPEGVINSWHGVVREIAEPERIVWTCFIDNADGTLFSGETVLTVTLEDFAGKTRLALHQAVFETTALRDAHSNGWNGAFVRLAEHLASA